LLAQQKHECLCRNHIFSNFVFAHADPELTSATQEN
jgi:hypothetical protein